jgi:hypothetical protein
LNWLKKCVASCGLQVNGLEKQHKVLNWLTNLPGGQTGKTNGTNKTNQTAVSHPSLNVSSLTNSHYPYTICIDYEKGKNARK